MLNLYSRYIVLVKEITSVVASFLIEAGLMENI